MIGRGGLSQSHDSGAPWSGAPSTNLVSDEVSARCNVLRQSSPERCDSPLHRRFTRQARVHDFRLPCHLKQGTIKKQLLRATLSALRTARMSRNFIKQTGVEYKRVLKPNITPRGSCDFANRCTSGR